MDKTTVLKTKGERTRQAILTTAGPGHKGGPGAAFNRAARRGHGHEQEWPLRSLRVEGGAADRHRGVRGLGLRRGSNRPGPRRPEGASARLGALRPQARLPRATGLSGRVLLRLDVGRVQPPPRARPRPDRAAASLLAFVPRACGRAGPAVGRARRLPGAREITFELDSFAMAANWQYQMFGDRTVSTARAAPPASGSKASGAARRPELAPSTSIVRTGCRGAQGRSGGVDGRTIQSSPMSRTLMHAGDCSRWPNIARRPVSAVRDDRAVDAAVENGEHDVPVGIGKQAVERGEDAIEQRADRLAAEELRLLRDESRQASTKARSSSSSGMSPRRPGSISRSSGHDSGSASGATIRAVSSVRGSPLVITRSNRMPEHRGGRARLSRPSAVSGTVSGCTGRPSSK